MDCFGMVGREGSKLGRQAACFRLWLQHFLNVMAFPPGHRITPSPFPHQQNCANGLVREHRERFRLKLMLPKEPEIEEGVGGGAWGQNACIESH